MENIMSSFEIPENDAGRPIDQAEQEKDRIIEKEKLERIPSSEEVLLLFEKLAGENNYETVRKLEDESGLYLWDIKIIQEDGSAEYSYIRKGDYRTRGLPGGSAPETAIHVIYFDKEGDYVSGSPVYKFINGEWKHIFYPLMVLENRNPKNH
jgi:hypothetical protein